MTRPLIMARIRFRNPARTNHQYMSQKEHHEKSCDKEVYGARRLVAAQNRDWNQGFKGRRHGQPVQMINGKHKKITTRYSGAATRYTTRLLSHSAARSAGAGAIEIQPAAWGERSERAGSKFRRKCPPKNPKAM